MCIMASNEDTRQDRLRRRWERVQRTDEEDRWKCTAGEREAKSINPAIKVYLRCTYIKTLSNRLARHREYNRCRHAAMIPEQHQQQRERHQALNE